MKSSRKSVSPNYTDKSSPNAQNMRSVPPGMPLTSDNARVDLSDDPLSGLDEQNDTGSCTGAEFGGYGRYSNGYTENPDPIRAKNSIHPESNTHETEKEKRRKSRNGFYLAVAVSAAALGAAVWLGAEIPIQPSDPIQSSETAQTGEDAPASASKEDIPKTIETENFVLSYDADSEKPSTAEIPEVSDESLSETASADSEGTETDTDLPEAAETAAAEEISSETPESFVLPVENGVITQPFSKGELVKSKTLGVWRTHDGTDFAAEEGTPILAIADGTVEAAEKNARWGNTVQMTCGDYTVYYYALGDNILVQPGETVSAGKEIARAGNSSLVESEEPPHFHLAVQKGNDWIDPAILLGLESENETDA